MSKIYSVAVFRRGNEIEVMTVRGVPKERHKEQETMLLSDGYKLDSMVAMTDRNLFNKYHLKARLKELRTYVKQSEEYLSTIKDEEVREESRACFNDYVENVLMAKIARLTRRCLENEIEVTDELALQCLDYINSTKY